MELKIRMYKDSHFNFAPHFSNSSIASQNEYASMQEKILYNRDRKQITIDELPYTTENGMVYRGCTMLELLSMIYGAEKVFTSPVGDTTLYAIGSIEQALHYANLRSQEEHMSLVRLNLERRGFPDATFCGNGGAVVLEFEECKNLFTKAA